MGAPPPAVRLAHGTADDVESCVDLWIAAVEARDGHPAVAGTRDRCLAKFERQHVAFIVARDGEAVAGFGLLTVPASGAVTDPPHAAYLALLAVAADAQGRGIGTAVLDALIADAAAAGHAELVLHVLTGNTAAVHLYTSRGWVPHGDPHEHPLSGEASQTYVLRQR